MDIATLSELVGNIFHALPWWVVGVLVLAVTALVTLALHGVAFRLIERLSRPRLGEFGQRLLHRIFYPTRLGALVLTLSIALQAVPIGERAGELLSWTLLLAFIALVGWCAVVLVETAADLYSLRFPVEGKDPLLSRRHVTQVRLLRRTAVIIIYFITFAALLMTIPAVRQFGVSLFASAGVAGLVVGLAARPLLSNLIAGIQIAVTQPLRIGDDVVIEGEFGSVEEIRTTYVVLKTWDWRRLVLPLSSVVEKPFQNWTLTTPPQIGTIFWYVDHMTPVQPIREKFLELVKRAALWDGQVAVLQVTDVTRDAVQLRGLVSAPSAGAAWDLRCEIREQLMRWMQETYPQSLPLLRQVPIPASEGQKEVLSSVVVGRVGGDGAAKGS